MKVYCVKQAYMGHEDIVRIFDTEKKAVSFIEEKKKYPQDVARPTYYIICMFVELGFDYIFYIGKSFLYI